jgi:hypothetical protein
VERQQGFRQPFVARKHQAARIASGVGETQQFEVTDDVLVEYSDVVEILEQIEGDVRPPVVDRLAHDAEVFADAETLDLVAEETQVGAHVVLRFPLDLGEVVSVDVRGRHQFPVHQGEDAQPPHSHTRCRPLCM